MQEIKITDQTQILSKTAEHRERNATCVLEPYYNLAHVHLNLTVIWLIC